MIIVPEKDPNLVTDPEVLPIKVYIQNRADLLAVMLRIVRFLFQTEACGPGLVWKDGRDTGIHIFDLWPDNPADINTYPCICLSVGARSWDEMFMNENASGSGIGTRTKTSNPKTQITAEVRGRNKLETLRISDYLADSLYILHQDIKGSVINLLGIYQLYASEVSPLGTPSPDVGDNPFIFRGMVSWVADYMVDYNLTQLPFGSAPSPEGGAFFGNAESSTQESPYNPDGSLKGMFTFAYFVGESINKDDQTDKFVVSKKIILPQSLDPDPL